MGIKPRRIAYYKRAFRHISVPHEYSESYENLEFLGDAIIGAVVAEYLVKHFPHEPVGKLTRIRANSVSMKPLRDLAVSLGLEEYIEIERSRLRDAKGVEDSVLADCVESIVGAIFLDRGMPAARRFVLRHIGPVIDDAVETGDLVDHKSRLQEYLQHRFKQVPRYRKIDAAGPDHARTYTVECAFRGKVLSKGTGTSLKRAEQDAARKAMKRYRKKPQDSG